MRILTAGIVLCMLTLPALAADAEGKITKIDEAQMTITLEDGATYKLPAEIDLAAVEDGMDVVVAYREVDNGVKQITDMLLPE